jgi:hypothetical protein
MSLLSLLNGTQSSQTYNSSGLSAAAQKVLAAAKSTAAATTTSTTSQTGSTTSDVSISADALAAAQAKEDNGKDFTTLSGEVRAALDAQYGAAKAAGKKGSAPGLSALSGRAVAAIALNRTGAFSRSEVMAAKSELRTRTQEDFARSAMASGGGASGIAAYSSQLVSQFDAMSDEEREARGWTDSMRASASAFVQKSSTPSLWDKLGGDS